MLRFFMKNIFFFLLLTQSLNFLANANTVIAHNGMENFLAEHGVILKSCHMSGSYKRLVAIFNDHITYIENDIDHKEDLEYKANYQTYTHMYDIPLEKKEKLLPFLKHGLTMLRNSTVESDKKYACYESTRLLYSFVSLADVHRHTNLSDVEALINGFKPLKNVNFPQNIKRFNKNKIGRERAVREANFLIAEGVLTKSELTGEELAKVDIRDDDPLYNTDIHINMDKRDGNGRVKTFIERVENALSLYIQKSFNNENLKYSFNDNTKTIFLKEIKRFRKKEGTGHQPVLKVHDEFLVDYQLTFGRTSNVDPVVNHLHLAMGGHFAALKTAHNEENPIILVLNKKTKATRKNEKKLLTLERKKIKHMHKVEEMCQEIATLNALKKCFELSHHHFRNFSPFVIESGKISFKNVNEVVKFSETPVERLQDLIGREYVILKHVSLEVKNNEIFYVAGAVPLSTMRANENRSHRSSGIFHMYIQNPRVKDFHYRSVVLNPDYFPHLKNRNKFQKYFEYPYSNHRSLGHNILFSSLKNFYQLPDGKMDVKDPSPIKEHFVSHNYFRRNHLMYQKTFLVSPTSWDHSTTSDNIWMARRIVTTLSDDVIKEAVKKAHLSKEWEEQTASSLIQRRNQLEKMYKLSTENQ